MSTWSMSGVLTEPLLDAVWGVALAADHTTEVLTTCHHTADATLPADATGLKRNSAPPSAAAPIAPIYNANSIMADYLPQTMWANKTPERRTPSSPRRT